jgi:hypothetical protein
VINVDGEILLLGIYPLLPRAQSPDEQEDIGSALNGLRGILDTSLLN